MRFDHLQGWLDWQQTLNPKSIDLGLERVRKVFKRLNLPAIGGRVISVAGTNGKGSTVAYYEAWLTHAGYRVASYTSPHILRYNERIRLNRQAVTDDALCRAFHAIDRARGDIALTYFEFGTLAALYLMAEFEPDVAILEVGLGGRLDAVNIIDADLAHITPIGLDHQDWLGDTRELIAAEKAGILRQHALAVINMPDVPASLQQRLQQLHCQASILNQHYHLRPLDDGQIEWSNSNRRLRFKPPLAGLHQGLNIAGVLAGLEALDLLQDKSEAQIVAGFADTRCPGRLQRLATDFPFSLWVDVGHNVDAAVALAQAIQQMQPSGRVVVLLGMLEDKDSEAFVQAMANAVDEWWLLALDCDRGQSAQQLAQKLPDDITPAALFDDADAALQHAVSSLDNQDILLAAGSFMTVEAVLNSVNS